MSQFFYDVVAPHVLDLEGGYVDDPDDPGGETRWGISKRSYPNLDIKNLTKEAALDIYKRDFWDGSGALIEDIDQATAMVLFDMALNSGAKTAIKKLQETLHVAQDGVIGPQTRGALADSKGTALLVDFFAAREMFYTRLKTWPAHGRGWTRRLFKLAFCVAKM